MHCSTIGKMIVPPPLMMRAAEAVNDQSFVRTRFAIHSRGHKSIRNKTASTARPAMTQTLENSNIKTSLFTRTGTVCSVLQSLKLFHLREFVPLADVGHALFVAADDHFDALFEREPSVTSRTGAAPHAVLLEDDFPGAAGGDRNADLADANLRDGNPTRSSELPCRAAGAP